MTMNDSPLLRPVYLLDFAVYKPPEEFKMRDLDTVLDSAFSRNPRWAEVCSRCMLHMRRSRQNSKQKRSQVAFWVCMTLTFTAVPCAIDNTYKRTFKYFFVGSKPGPWS